MTNEKMAGFSKGVVVDTEDPAGFNRVKVRILELHGAVTDDVYANAGANAARKNRVDDNSLPWLEVCYPYGLLRSPEVNQVVLVGYFNGSSNQPVVVGWLGYDYTDKEEILVRKLSNNNNV